MPDGPARSSAAASADETRSTSASGGRTSGSGGSASHVSVRRHSVSTSSSVRALSFGRRRSAARGAMSSDACTRRVSSSESHAAVSLSVAAGCTCTRPAACARRYAAWTAGTDVESARCRSSVYVSVPSACWRMRRSTASAIARSSRSAPTSSVHVASSARDTRVGTSIVASAHDASAPTGCSIARTDRAVVRICCRRCTIGALVSSTRDGRRGTTGVHAAASCAVRRRGRTVRAASSACACSSCARSMCCRKYAMCARRSTDDGCGHAGSGSVPSARPRAATSCHARSTSIRPTCSCGAAVSCRRRARHAAASDGGASGEKSWCSADQSSASAAAPCIARHARCRCARMTCASRSVA